MTINEINEQIISEQNKMIVLLKDHIKQLEEAIAALPTDKKE